jgi:trypsin-like peptidase
MTKLSLLFILTGSLVGTQAPERRKDIPAIARDAAGCIVSIIMSDKDGHPVAQGSGFLISKDGRVVTNYHVIENGTSAIVKLPDGAFFVVDGVLASDKDRDVAVIKAHGENFRTLKLGNSDRLQVGEQVVAIGNPLFLESTVSNGIVSGIRTLEGGKFLQVTTPISHGSSGGPLFNMAGEVVGITTLYIKGGENLNFAIPINDAKRLLSAASSDVHHFPNEAETATTPTDNDAFAATPSVCRKNLALWGAEATGRPSHEVTRSIPIVELSLRLYEMNQCGIVDNSDPDREAAYQNVYGVYLSPLVGRWHAFVVRHKLINSFLAAEAGKEFTGGPTPDDPTIEQCRANANEAMGKPISQIDVVELIQRDSEMDRCRNVDADGLYKKKYQIKLVEYMDEIGWRYKLFLEKTGLMDMVIKEDATVPEARE